MITNSMRREDQFQNHSLQAEAFENITALILEVRQCQEALQ